MSQTSSLYNSVISECYFYFLLSHIYNSFLFIQSHFIAKLIKTDEKHSLIIFMFFIEHPLCFWLWVLGMYNAPVKEENLLRFFFLLFHQWKFWKCLLSNFWNIKTSAQIFPERSSLVTLSNVTPASTSTLPYDALLFSLEYLLPCDIILVSYGPASFSPSWRWKFQEQSLCVAQGSGPAYILSVYLLEA